MKWLVLSYCLIWSLAVAESQTNDASSDVESSSGASASGSSDTKIPDTNPSSVADDSSSGVQSSSDVSVSNSESSDDSETQASESNPSSVTDDGESSSGSESNKESTSTAEAASSASVDHSSGEVSDIKRTVILIHKETAFGQTVFIRGGHDHSHLEGCGNRDDLHEDPCSIPILNRQLDVSGSVEQRDAWADGDGFLDWYGSEIGQSSYNGVPAQGTPAQWTTNDKENDYYSNLNSFGAHYWLVDVDMDCSETNDGFFELKGFLSNNWEPTYSRLDVRCDGDGAEDPPIQSNNHFGKCGYINVFEWGQGQCSILTFTEESEDK